MGICIPGFTPNQPVDVTITLPGGRVERGVAKEYDSSSTHGLALLSRYILPGEPLGVYRVVASQGTMQATGQFSVILPPIEILQVIAPDPDSEARGPAGTVFSVAFAGFRPNAPIVFYIYYRVDERTATARYLTTVSASANAAGELLYRLASLRGDIPGRYCLLLPREVPKPDVTYESSPCWTPQDSFTITK